MSEMQESHESQVPELEEDPKLARILGLVLLIVVPIFGFYYGTVFGKTDPVDGKIWFHDYQWGDIQPGLLGAGIGLAIAFVMNLYIWIRYTKQTNEDLVREWYEPQAHKSGGHH